VTRDVAGTDVKVRGTMAKHQFTSRVGVFFSGASLSRGISGTMRSGSFCGAGGMISGSFISKYFQIVVHGDLYAHNASREQKNVPGG